MLKLLLPGLAALAATATFADTACLPQPTRDCVFDMAIRQTLAAPNPIRMASGFLMVASLQEAEGLPAYRQTFAAMAPALRAINPDPDKMKNAVAGAIWGLGVAGAYQFPDKPGQPQFIFAAPETLAMARGLYADLAAQADPDAAPEPPEDSLYDQGKAGDLAAIHARLKTATDAQARKLALSAAEGLIARGDPDAALGLSTALPDLLPTLRSMVIANLLAQKDFTAAETLAASWAELSDRVLAYSTIALALAKDGQLAKAEGLALHPDFRGLPEQSYIALTLAEVFARTGQPDYAQDYLQKAGTRASDHDFDRITVMAALVGQDFAAAIAHLRAAQKPDRADQTLMAAVNAFFAFGNTDIEPFLAALPPEFLPDALTAIGYVQVAAKDADAALATLARVQSLEPAADPGFDMRLSLALLLAEQGRAVQAVELADALGIETVTAQVAALIE